MIRRNWCAFRPGTFLLGEEPRRHHLPTYHIAKTPTTVAQFAAFVQATGHRTTAEKNKSEYTWRTPRGSGTSVASKSDHPVTQVSWDDAVAYCKWLSRSTGRSYRLPTIAEWEKAARGTDGRTYPWGNWPPNDQLCNFDHNVDDTTPVGRYPSGASPYGCLDMAGNVWEWTNEKDSDGRYWVKGGSWYSDAGYCQSVRRRPRVLLRATAPTTRFSCGGRPHLVLVSVSWLLDSDLLCFLYEAIHTRAGDCPAGLCLTTGLLDSPRHVCVANPRILLEISTLDIQPIPATIRTRHCPWTASRGRVGASAAANRNNYRNRNNNNGFRVVVAHIFCLSLISRLNRPAGNGQCRFGAVVPRPKEIAATRSWPSACARTMQAGTYRRGPAPASAIRRLGRAVSV